MEQRRLRLGDILDDYCPRERRVTNHAIVAMIEEDVKQTRCTTCDAEHAYKGGKLPRRRKKETPSALYKEVLAGLADADAPVLAVPAGTHLPSIAQPVEPESVAPQIVEPVPAIDAAADREDAPQPAEAHDEDAYPGVDEGPVHRRLIRATLPRPEGQKDTRPVPDFTVRHGGGRPGGGQFRNGRPVRGHAGGNGNGSRGPGARPQGARGGHGRGPRPDQGRGQGGRGAQGRGEGGGFRGRKRSR